jgi:hypothetical protein
MTPATRFPSFSVVVETDNLAIVDMDELDACLDSIARQGNLLARADGVFVADGGIVPEVVLERLRSRHPWLSIIRAGAGTSYVELKIAGALKTDSELIVLCDGDLRYEPGWLEALLDGFRLRPDADIIAGETTTPITGPYSLAFALTFNFPRFTGDHDLAPSTTYWANNCAVRRSTLAKVPLPDPEALYRGQNLVHTMRLRRDSAVILRQPKARGWHAVIPPSEIVQRYFRLGRDAAVVRHITSAESGAAYLGAMEPDRPGTGVLGRLNGRISQIARSQPGWLLALPLAIPALLIMGAAYVAGRSTARLRG